MAHIPIYFKKTNGMKIFRKKAMEGHKATLLCSSWSIFWHGFLVQPTSVRIQGSRHSLLIFQEDSNNRGDFIKMPIKISNILTPKSKKWINQSSSCFLTLFFFFPPWYKQMGRTKMSVVIQHSDSISEASVVEKRDQRYNWNDSD